jgi:hypothetical protein
MGHTEYVFISSPFQCEEPGRHTPNPQVGQQFPGSISPKLHIPQSVSRLNNLIVYPYHLTHGTSVQSGFGLQVGQHWPGTVTATVL